MTAAPRDSYPDIVERLLERAKTAREENTGTALGDAVHFEEAARQLKILKEQRNAWQKVAGQAGICMACAMGAPDTFGCSDCLNTGWDGGAPRGFVPIPAPAQASTMTDDEMQAQAQIYLDRMYIARADARQKSMGLAYIEAERQDLARTLVKFARFVASQLSSTQSLPPDWKQDQAETSRLPPKRQPSDDDAVNFNGRLVTWSEIERAVQERNAALAVTSTEGK